MKRFNYILTTFLLLLVGLSSCKGLTKNPFSGTDNYLLDLVLTAADGKSYVAKQLSEDKLIIEAPNDVDLQGAKATYRISDQATILPEPTKVEDWNMDQAFLITSYSGKRRTVVVQISRNKVEESQSVMLTTDAEVEAFAAKGVEHIKGHLIIGATSGIDSIKNIDALTALRKVDYDVIINPTYKGDDLSGLRNLRSTGSLIIQSQKLKEASLRQLREVFGDVTVTGAALKAISFPELRTMLGTLQVSGVAITELVLPRLERTQGVELNDCSSLSTLTAREMATINGNLTLVKLPKLQGMSLPKLKEVNGEIKLNDIPMLANVSLNKLETVEKFEMQKTEVTELYLQQLTEVNLFSINSTSLSRIVAPNLATIKGDLLLEGCPISDLNQVGVRQVEGKLSLTNLSNLQDISDFLARLSAVNRVELTDINAGGIWNLGKSGVKELKIERCRHVEELILPAKMNKVELLGDQMTQVDGLQKVSGLEEVASDFSLRNYQFKEPIHLEIAFLRSVGGSINLRLSNLLSLTFPNLATAQGIKFDYIGDSHKGKGDITAAYAMKKISAPLLTELETIDFNLHDLEEVEMPRLKVISKKLSISCYYPVNANNVLTDLNGLSALEEVPSVEFVNLKAFRDFSFLKKSVESGKLKKLSVRSSFYNPKLEDLQQGRYVKQN